MAKGKEKLPFRFGMADGSLFAMAGLWAPWGDDEGNRYVTATILTTQRIGEMSFAKIVMGWLCAVAKATLWRSAKVSGVISPTSSRMGTMMKRLNSLFSAPNTSITMAAEMTEAATFTNSLPMSMVTIRRRG